jgi:hypothetical protein
MIAVDIDDLANAMMFLDHASDDAEAWADRKTGAVYVRSTLGWETDDLPEDSDESSNYVALPSFRDLDLGNELVFAFVEAELPQDYEQVREMFRKKGAYGRFSRLLDARNARDKWHRFKDEQTEAALRAWCADHGLKVKQKA